MCLVPQKMFGNAAESAYRKQVTSACNLLCIHTVKGQGSCWWQQVLEFKVRLLVISVALTFWSSPYCRQACVCKERG